MILKSGLKRQKLQNLRRYGALQYSDILSFKGKIKNIIFYINFYLSAILSLISDLQAEVMILKKLLKFFKKPK